MFAFVTFDVDNTISWVQPDHRILNLCVKLPSDIAGSETHIKPNVFFQGLTHIRGYVSTVTYFMRFLHSSRLTSPTFCGVKKK